MGTLLSRIIMWAIIVGMVWYLSLQYREQMPDNREEAAMRSAAEHYLRQKDAMNPDRDLPPSPDRQAPIQK